MKKIVIIMVTANLFFMVFFFYERHFLRSVENTNSTQSIDKNSCNFDSDCVIQVTDCGGCSCPIAVNKESYAKMYCSDYDGELCYLYCPTSTPLCVDGSCVAVTVPIE